MLVLGFTTGNVLEELVKLLIFYFYIIAVTLLAEWKLFLHTTNPSCPSVLEVLDLSTGRIAEVVSIEWNIKSKLNTWKLLNYSRNSIISIEWDHLITILVAELAVSQWMKRTKSWLITHPIHWSRIVNSVIQFCLA